MLKGICQHDLILFPLYILSRHSSFYLYILKVTDLSAGASHFLCHYDPFSNSTPALWNLLIDLNLNVSLNPETTEHDSIHN